MRSIGALVIGALVVVVVGIDSSVSLARMPNKAKATAKSGISHGLRPVQAIRQTAYKPIWFAAPRPSATPIRQAVHKPILKAPPAELRKLQMTDRDYSHPVMGALRELATPAKGGRKQMEPLPQMVCPIDLTGEGSFAGCFDSAQECFDSCMNGDGKDTLKLVPLVSNSDVAWELFWRDFWECAEQCGDGAEETSEEEDKSLRSRQAKQGGSPKSIRRVR